MKNFKQVLSEQENRKSNRRGKNGLPTRNIIKSVEMMITRYTNDLKYEIEQKLKEIEYADSETK